MRWFITLAISLGILGGAFAISAVLKATRPGADMSGVVKPLPVVEVLKVEPETVELRVPSQGMVEPDQETSLAAEVAGKIVWVSPKLRAGLRFDEGEEMVRLDDGNYRAALAEAKAQLAEAKLTLATEEARAEQAEADWKRLGRGGEPGDLVLRKPQLESARARVVASEAAVAKAEEDLDRTTIRAPYESRVRVRMADVGAYLTPGALVAEVNAVEPFEVRLPVSLDQYALIDLEGDEMPSVWLRSDVGGTRFEWEAKVVRREAEVDRESRSIYLVGRVHPGPATPGVMQPGLFVQAEIEGRTLQGIYRVPLVSFRGRNQIVLVDEAGLLEFRDVKVLRREGDIALVSEGLEPGDQVCLTPLQVMLEGMEVEVREVQPAEQPPAAAVQAAAPKS